MRLLLLPAILLLAVGCGGASTEPAGGPASSEPASSAATAAAPRAASGGGSGTSSASLDACKLITADEVARVTGLTGVAEAGSAAGDPAFCIYGTTAGVQAAMLTYSRSGAAKDFDVLSSGTQSVSGLGEKAHWQTAGKTLSILKNGTMLQISAVNGLSDSEVTAARRLDLAKQLGGIAVARQ